MESEALRALYQLDGERLGKTLLLHAVCESRKYDWRRGGSGFIDGHNTVLAQGLSPMDVIQQAVAQTLDGSRPWDSEKYPDITSHLKWVATSIVSNIATSADNRHLQEMPQNSAGEPDEELQADPDYCRANPEPAVLTDISEPDATEMEQKVFDAVKDDPLLVEVLNHLRNEEKPRNIAVIMKLTEKEIYRLTQKLRRRLAPVLRRPL